MGGTPGSKAGDESESGVCWRDVRVGWARPDAAQKPERTRRRPDKSPERLVVPYLSRSGLNSLNTITRAQAVILNHKECIASRLSAAKLLKSISARLPALLSFMRSFQIVTAAKVPFPRTRLHPSMSSRNKQLPIWNSQTRCGLYHGLLVMGQKTSPMGHFGPISHRPDLAPWLRNL